MRTLMLSVLMFAAASPLQAVEHRFLRIYSPIDKDRYLDTANIAVNGYLYLPEWKGDLEALGVRVRLYRPVAGKLVVEQEVIGETRDADEEGVYRYLADISRKNKPPLLAGQYVVRVDCLDKSEEGSPMLATQSVFIDVVPRPRQQEVTARSRSSESEEVRMPVETLPPRSLPVSTSWTLPLLSLRP